MGSFPPDYPPRRPDESYEDYIKRRREFADKHIAPYCSFRGNAGSAFLYVVFGIGMVIATIVILISEIGR